MLPRKRLLRTSHLFATLVPPARVYPSQLVCRLTIFPSRSLGARAGSPHSPVLFRQHRQRHTVRLTSSSSTTTLVIVGIAVSVAYGSVLFYDFHQSDGNSIEESWSKAGEDTEDIRSFEAIMVQGVQPGRPGNLSVEQEIKLQEFWKATLKVFGVSTVDGGKAEELTNGEAVEPSGEGAGEEDEAPAQGIATAATASSTTDKDKKDKKKKRGLFSRRRKDSKSDASSATAAAAQPSSSSSPQTPVSSHNPAAATDSEDKYGQTKEFQAALASSTPEELRRAFWSMVKCDHPDALLLRFLRARKWDIDKALVMMVSTMHWRAREMHVEDDIVLRGEGAALADSKRSKDDETKEKDGSSSRKAGEDFMAQLRLGKSFLRGVDREGRPMCTVRVRLHRQGEQSEQSLERYTVHVLETARLLLVPPVDTASIVFDMTDFSMANMDYTPVKFMIKCFEANYPESLGVILVHKAPWIFQGIWKIIKGWLDPVVAGKVHFTNSASELEHYIAPEHVIKELGGSDPWEYHYPEPVEGENSRMDDAATRDKLQAGREETVREFEAATREWLSGPANPNDELRKRRADIAQRLRAGYWELDPYVRARSLYDRLGVIGPGGRIDFYPERPGEGKVMSAADGTVVNEKEKGSSAGGNKGGPTPAGHEEDGVD